MNFIEILIVSIGLAMDAFAVAVCKGINCKEIDRKKCSLVGIFFGGFQALMPLIGFYIGAGLRSLVIAIDHYIVFGILVVIGANMVYECFCEKIDNFNSEINAKSLFLPAIATSIDALSVGITFAFLKVNIWLSILVIGVVTFILSYVGVLIGNNFGNKSERKAKLIGGIILIVMGIKVLFEHFK